MIAGRSLLRVGKNAFARLAAQAWARLLSLGLVALVARYAGPDGLGRYALVLTLVGILGALADLGLNIWLTREAARDIGEERQRELLGFVLPLKAGLSVGAYAALILLTPLAPFPAATRSLLALGGLSLLPEALTGAMGALINARQRMEVTGILAMITRLAALVGALAVLNLGYGVAGALVCSVAANAVNALLHSLVLRRWGLYPRIRWNPAAWWGMLAEAYPFALTGIIAVVYARLDLVLLSAWRGELVAGWYAAAYKLWEAMGLIPASLLDAMFPEMSRLSGNREGMRRLRDVFDRGGQGMLAGGTALAVAGALAAAPLMGLVYGSGASYDPAVPAFRILVWAIPAMFLYLLGGHVLYALGRQRYVTKAMLLVGLVNVTLNLIVIPRWSYMGASGVALGSELLLFGLLYPPARRALKTDKADESEEHDAVALP